MRRFLFGVVIASVTAAMPSWAFGGDREIAKAVMAELQQHKAAGNLKGFDLDMQVEDGIIYLDGKVSSRAQRTLVAQAAANAVGIGNIVNRVKVNAPKVAKPTPKVQTVAQTKAAPKRQPVQAASGTRNTRSVSDAAVTDAVIGKLQGLKSAGRLRGFDLDVSTVNGDLWLKGQVANSTQKKMVLETARRVRGVARVVDDIKIKSAGNVRTASTGTPAPVPAPKMAQGKVPQGSSMPTGQPRMAPQPFAHSALASAPMGGMVQGGVPGGHPVAMQGGNFGGGAARYDQPNMPNYAWPSYAAAPNYAAVSYPKQYSPSAWPYIGPFYPYPQVPLGWRKVALEWDDGLWYLDFTSK